MLQPAEPFQHQQKVLAADPSDLDISDHLRQDVIAKNATKSPIAILKVATRTVTVLNQAAAGGET